MPVLSYPQCQHETPRQLCQVRREIGKIPHGHSGGASSGGAGPGYEWLPPDEAGLGQPGVNSRFSVAEIRIRQVSKLLPC